MENREKLSEAFQAWKNPRTQFDYCLSHPWYGLVASLQSELLVASNRFFADEGINPVLTPMTTGSVSSPMGFGSDSVPVEIELFERNVYLSDSTQFFLELLLRHHMNGVYYAMPSFRGESSDSSHLNEFFHIEAEVHGRLEDVISLASRYVKSVTAGILAKQDSRIAGCRDSMSVVHNICSDNEIPVLTFKEVKNISGMTSDCFAYHANLPISLTRIGESLIYRHVGGPCWVTRYPQMAVPFYQAVDSATDEALNADLLLGGREVVGAGQRHSNVADIHAALALRGNDPEKYLWYLDMKQRASIQSAGFGMGIERYLLWLLGHDDIRDLELFLRTKETKSYA